MKFAVTQSGLSHLIPPIQAKILAAVRGMKFPDHGGKKGPCSFNMHGAHVTGATAEPFQIRSVAVSGVEVVIPRLTIHVAVSHHFHCCKRVIFKFCKSFSGNSEITFAGRIAIVLDLGSMAGRPTLKTRYVDLSVLQLTVNTHSKYGGQIAHGIRQSVLAGLGSVPGKIKSQADSMAKKTLEKLPLLKKIDQFVEVDASMADNMSFGKHKKKKPGPGPEPAPAPLPTPHPPPPGVPFLSTRHKGEVYAIAHHHEAPFTASPMPDGEAEGMAQVFLSDFLVNSAGFAYYDAGVLKRTITDQDIPASIPVRLNTKTFEEIFPSLYAKYPDMLMTIDVNAPKAPSARVLDGKLTESVAVDLGFNVVDPAARITSRFSTLKSVFSLSMTLDADVTVRAEGSAIKGHADLVKMDIKVKESQIGPIELEACQPLFEMVVKEMVFPKLNVKLEKGMILPVVHGFHFVNPSVSVKPGYIAVRTNLQLAVEELDPFDFEVEQELLEEEEPTFGDIDEEGEEYQEVEDNLMEEDAEQDAKHADKPPCHLDECREYFDWCTKKECNFFE